mgnify:CR=1 FL=1
MISVRDNLGLHLSGSDPDSLEHYERGLGQFQCYAGDPLAAVEAALRVEEQQTLVQSVAVDAGMGFHPHRLLPAGQFAAVLRAIQAQHRSQRRELRGARERIRGCARDGAGECPQHRHGGYQLTATLADSVRPGAV